VIWLSSSILFCLLSTSKTPPQEIETLFEVSQLFCRFFQHCFFAFEWPLYYRLELYLDYSPLTKLAINSFFHPAHGSRLSRRALVIVTYQVNDAVNQ